ncbi:hypothetical protein BX600DRAFT_74177 [Xylariales sp. PMI_506]|nr:hypothetical protein BX600DRAFT_74177 [Xylariales sp. PMI_506]
MPADDMAVCQGGEDAWARHTEARRPTLSSLLALPTDILLHILCIVHDISPMSIADITPVCSQLNEIARNLRCQNIYVDLGKKNIPERLNHVLQPSFLPLVRLLRVYSRHEEEQHKSPGLELVANVVPRMTGLRDLHWDGASLPDNVLQCLKSRPHVRLHLSIIMSRGGNQIAAQLLKSLPGNLNVASIRAHITFIDAKDSPDTTQGLKRVLLSCPNLRCLSLNISQPHGGCVILPMPTVYHGLGFVQGERLPPLEELEIVSYPWGGRRFRARRGSASNNARHTHQGGSGYPGGGDEMAYWSEYFDWSRLRRIKVSNPDVLAGIIADKLCALESVEFTGYLVITAHSVQEFLEAVNSSLQSIVIPSIAGVNLTSLQRHGKSLRRLHIHHFESYTKAWTDHTVSLQQLTTLRDTLSLLEELEIDIDRGEGGEWPWESLEILASFDGIRSLKLWFELNIKARGACPLPHLTMKSAGQLFSYIRQRSPKQALKRLDVCSGAPPPLPVGPITDEMYWPKENTTNFICEIGERDYEAAKGLFSVCCPVLSDELNIDLRRIVNGEIESYLPNNAQMVAFKVALRGPLPMAEWLNLHQKARYHTLPMPNFGSMGPLPLKHKRGTTTRRKEYSGRPRQHDVVENRH